MFSVLEDDRRFLDVWDVGSFDNALLLELQQHKGLIRDYVTTDRQMMLERQASDRLRPFGSNPHAAAFHAWTEHIVMPLMEARVMRAWHYTRLLDNEVRCLRASGIILLSLATAQQRVETLIESDVLDRATAAALLAASPLHDSDGPGRTGKFWMVSEPVDIDHGGVEPLLESWGGEGIYFRQRNPELQTLLKSIGRARVVELSVPIAATSRAYSAAQAVVAAFGRSLGCEPDGGNFDLYVEQALEPAAVLAIHTEGEANFAALGRGYPANFRRRDCSI